MGCISVCPNNDHALMHGGFDVHIDLSACDYKRGGLGRGRGGGGGGVLYEQRKILCDERGLWENTQG